MTLSPKVEALIKKIAGLHDPESKFLDDLGVIMTELRETLTAQEVMLEELSLACIARTKSPEAFPVHVVACRICGARWWNKEVEVHREGCPVMAVRRHLGTLELGVPSTLSTTKPEEPST